MLIYDENQDKLYSTICNHLTIYFCGGIYSIPFYTSIFFMSDRVYIAIDLKSFYASVECIERGLDPLTTNLIVADKSRSEKTICLAISPSLKAYGISGRPRLFEVIQRVREVNLHRRRKCPCSGFDGESCDSTILSCSPNMAFPTTRQRLAWLYILNTVPVSMPCILNISRLKISMSIP